MKSCLFILVSVAHFAFCFANDIDRLVECVVNTDCPEDRVCAGERCVSPCLSVCRNNTVCHVTSHVAMCTCSPGYSGHPSLGCSKTEVFECEDSDDCEVTRVCHKHKCLNPCESVCGVNAACQVINHVATCSCNPGYSGNPIVGCSQIECGNSDDCKLNKVCVRQKCVDPCAEEVCGLNSECHVFNHVVMCICHPGYTGYPALGCSKIESPKSETPDDCDLRKVRADVCGANTIGQVVNGVAKCSCRPGYTGNPSLGCTNTTRGDPNSIKLLLAHFSEVSVLDVTDPKVISVLRYPYYLHSAPEDTSGVSYHFAKRFLFYKGPGSAAIIRNVVNTIGSTLVVDDTNSLFGASFKKNSFKIAVDWVHDKLYWIEHDKQAIMNCYLDEISRLRSEWFMNNITTLRRDLEFRWRANNIAVDPFAGYLFLVSRDALRRMNLDGTNMTTLHLKGYNNRGVYVLALDTHKRRVYYSSWDLRTKVPYIDSCDYEGKSERNIPIGDKWEEIHAVDVFRDHVYFGHFKRSQYDEVWSVDLASPDPTPTLITSVDKAFFDLKVYHPDVQKAP